MNRLFYWKGFIMIKAIATKYDGRFFRSRTEARWAVFFNAIGIKYEYEKEGFKLEHGCYLPDFWLPEIDCWIEIKGEKPTENENNLCSDLAFETKKRCFLFVGNPTITPDDGNNYTQNKYFTEQYGAIDEPYIFCACPDCGSMDIQWGGNWERNEHEINCYYNPEHKEPKYRFVLNWFFDKAIETALSERFP
jgi:hypothetical protein